MAAILSRPQCVKVVSPFPGVGAIVIEENEVTRRMRSQYNCVECCPSQLRPLATMETTKQFFQACDEMYLKKIVICLVSLEPDIHHLGRYIACALNVSVVKCNCSGLESLVYIKLRFVARSRYLRQG